MGKLERIRRKCYRWHSSISQFGNVLHIRRVITTHQYNNTCRYSIFCTGKNYRNSLINAKLQEIVLWAKPFFSRVTLPMMKLLKKYSKGNLFFVWNVRKSLDVLCSSVTDTIRTLYYSPNYRMLISLILYPRQKLYSVFIHTFYFLSNSRLFGRKWWPFPAPLTVASHFLKSKGS